MFFFMEIFCTWWIVFQNKEETLEIEILSDFPWFSKIKKKKKPHLDLNSS